MALISRKKQIFPVGESLRAYLARHGRLTKLPIHFDALSRYLESIAVYDKRGRDTLWETVLFSPSEREEINDALVQTYAILKVHGDASLMRHLVTDRIDVCTWGNTRPFRVRILNTLNENFDYFYVKRGDASRVFGLELEHILSPNRIDYLCDSAFDTIVEEHIAGIPGSDFIAGWLSDSHLDEVRLAKEFVKFNERCLVRLLGDMHAGNYVIDLTPDFDETHYRIRAIDFDQQSYESRCRVYLPQYYKENNPIVRIGMRCMTQETFKQYRHEERTLIATRAKSEQTRLLDLLSVMATVKLAPKEHVRQLAQELAAHHDEPAFRECDTMGELVSRSLQQLRPS